MDSYRKNWKHVKYHIFMKKTMSIKETEINLKNFSTKQSFSKKSKELH